MTRIPIRILALVIVALIGLPRSSPAQDVEFELVRMPGGDFVTSIVQDDDGFLWFATQEGLVRYDGYEFNTYAHAPLDTSSLSFDYVEVLHLGRDGTLWVGTYGGGLNRFNRETETFTRFRNDPEDSCSLGQDHVTALLEDRDGVLWVGTRGGLNRFDRTSECFTQYRHDPEDPTTISHDWVRAMLEDGAGRLWLGTHAGGLNRFDRDAGVFVRYEPDPENGTSLITGLVSALFEDSRGRFWVGAGRPSGGLHLMDREQGTFTRFRFDPDASDWPADPRPEGPWTGGGITAIGEDSRGTLWFGNWEGWLTRFDPETGTAVNFNHRELDPPATSGNRLFTIFESREGVLWFGSVYGPLYKLDPLRTRFESSSLGDEASNIVTSIHDDQDGAYWVGTLGGGLVRYEAEGSVTRYLPRPGDPTSLGHANVRVVYVDRQGVLWVGSNAGLDRFDRATATFTRFRHDANDHRSLGSGWVRAIHEDAQGRLWVGTTQGGLSLMDRSTGTFTRYEADPNDERSLSLNDVTEVLEDRQGRVWVGTWGGGLNRLEPQMGVFVRYLPGEGLLNPFITSIYEDEEGALWIGTRGGLHRMDPTGETFAHFSRRTTGLPGDAVLGIVGDDDGDLWIVTDEGLARFNGAANSIQVYGRHHGLEPSAFSQGMGAHRITGDGEILIGSRNGFYRFHPARVRTNSHPPDVVLTGFAANGASGEHTDAHWARIRESGSVRLSHDRSDFTFEFAAIHHSNPEQNRYAFMLEGYDDVWRDSGTLRTASYYKVPPGRYVFRVRAASSDGVWNEGGLSASVIVTPPWWRTGWAYAFYALVLVSGFVALGRIQRRRLLAELQARSPAAVPRSDAARPLRESVSKR